jgi:hypothetical protein
VTVKAPVAAVILIAGALLGIPLVLGGSGGPTAAGCGDLAVILDTIRTVESGGDYTARSDTSTASGAYQYVDSTWNDYRGYPSAYLATREIQDARAASDVQRILATYGDVAYVPIVWYWPAAVDDAAQLDIVPRPDAGNQLTVRGYQQRWLDVYEKKSSDKSASRCSLSGSASGDYALPIDRTLIDADPSMLHQPHHDYPAIDLMIPSGSPVYAVRGGTVARTVNWPYNCDRVDHCEETCGVGLSINGDEGARWIYCHGTNLNGLAVGDTVTTGQLLMWSGDTGRSGAPHLHLEIRVDDQQRCPQQLLAATYRRTNPIAPGDLPDGGCSF